MSGNSTEIRSFAFSPNNINPGLTGVTGVNVSAPNATNGSSINNLTNINNTQSGSLAIQSYISSLYDSAGLTSKNSTALTNQTISPAANNKTPLSAETTSNDRPTLSTIKVSTRSPVEVSDERRDKMGEGAGTSSSFPSTLQTAAHTYMKLQFEIYKRADARTAGNKSLTEAFYLPLPENLQVDFNVSYDTVDTGATGVIKSQIQSAAATIGSDAGAAAAVAGIATNLAKGAANMGERSAYAAIDSAESIAGGLVGGAAGASGEIQKALQQIPNPHPSVFFKGLPLRAFQFVWKLVPLQQEDAINLKDILDRIKKNILPELSGSGNSLTYPNMLQITFEGKGSDRYTKYLPCFVENMSINYTGEGTSAFFVDGAPVSILLTMQLRESELFTRDKARDKV